MTTSTTNSAGGACHGTNRKGEACNAGTRAGSNYCFFHDPAMAEERQKARKRGGRARHGRKVGSTGEDFPPVCLDTVADVLSYLSQAANDLVRLENSVSRNRAMAQLASVAVSVLEVGQMEERLVALEEALNGTR